MPAKISAIKSLKSGWDLGVDLGRGNADFAMILEFENADGYKEYSSHPAHLDFIDKFCKPIKIDNGRLAIQF